MVDRVFGLTFAASDEAELARSIAERPVPLGEGARIVATANIDHIVSLSRDAMFRSAYRSAWAVTADGMPVYLYAKLRGLAVPGRVTGSGMCSLILDQLSPALHRPFFVVNAQETADALRTRLTGRGFAIERLGFVVPPMGFERNAVYGDALSAAVENHGTTHLFMCVGSPKSEVWAVRHRNLIGDCYVLNFGAGLEYAAGIRRRAPRALQQVGLEWAWRLAHEPRRLFGRYLLNSWIFLWAVGHDLAGHDLAGRGI